MDERCLLVVRSDASVSREKAETLAIQVEDVRRKLSREEAPVILIEGGLHAYWLRPGESTVEADARAELLKKQAGES